MTAGLAAAVLANTVTAFASNSALTLNAAYNGSNKRALVVNNCPYDVYLWSVVNEQGCGEPFILKTGGSYRENYREDEHNKGVGVSIKLAKENQCKGVAITQLEYFLDQSTDTNFLDVSYVDCSKELYGGDCPGRKDGYYLKAGNADVATVADANNPHCPTFSCDSMESCDKTSYVNPDDVQTKSCPIDNPLDFYLCGKNGNTETDPEPSSSSEKQETPTPSSTPVKQEANVVAVAQVTSAPVEQPKVHNVWTEVVYVTEYQTVNVNAKRHNHGHVHRRFHA
ncbi:hypothetical protein BU24DRAFT_458993 [Aaosphaeria arxii CBS 175.79]|uniref:Osmotin, thaumatin-like protein n=1 Tax=Aaosphaeria arxii CBS 175.79 TaxID=1450172 RepID=A0A6A5Y463_9PLEO|nr:uncharacterized protein BU24DRAFT_458993 [Aaosphaeria arxii CBS 175.79]KAF2019304.1 hypothetical protein BU24DRAFT_458993 [Aaosphaeria arxii CBS 175.79]